MNDKAKRVIKKYYEFILTKVKLVFLQKKYRSNGVLLKYILKKNDQSKDLVVVFSSCTRRGIKARYNYMRTLKSIEANQLYILDDFADDHRGSYYLGPDWTFAEEAATLSLIKEVSAKLNSEKIICCGSSKGGYSAINFGLMIPGSYIVAGGPQYYLATYLQASQNIECLEHILGEVTEEKKENLDSRLKGKIDSISNPEEYHIFLHFSDKEHTYEEHVKDLLEEIKRQGFLVSCDIADYTNHSDISYYFPDFLVETIKRIISF